MTRLRSRGSMVAVAALLAIPLAACGEEGDNGAVATTTTAVVTTTAPTTTTIATTTTTSRRPMSTTAPAGRASVTVTVDGEAVALQRVCRGVDGAVVAIATTGRRIILVRELGLALRIGTEGGTFTETKDVRTTQTGNGTRYEGTIPVEGQPTPVTMLIADESGLTSC
ncbi:MAG: hypothetical protein ACRD1D_02720 [Acidimicrobiales bacterium]